MRSSGPTGLVTGALAMTLDNNALPAWSFQTQSSTIDTTVPLTLDLTASIANFTDAEAVHCDQLTIHLE